MLTNIYMKRKGLFSYFWHNLGNKHRLSLRNQHDDSEVWYVFISPLRAIAVFVALVLLIFIVILTTVAYTPVLDLIPGYPGNRSREMLVTNILRIDSLERELNDMRLYSDNIAMIMEGKTPVVRELQTADSVQRRREVVVPSREDSLLRAELEGTGRNALPDPVSVQRSRLLEGELIAPINGKVVLPYDPRAGRLGVGIRPVSGQVSAIQDGTVILNMWTPQDGYVAGIQHSGNFVSVYRHNAELLKPAGARVKRGEVIGYVADKTAADEPGTFYFELWYDGQPVDPEKYIAF